MKRLTMVLCLAVSAAVVSGCIPAQVSLKDVDVTKLELPVLKKSMDRVHSEIAARADGQLYVGAAEVDITTRYGHEGSIYIGGFDLGRKAKGVKDPVYAHAIYIDDGKMPYVLVTIDTIGYMNNEVDAVRELASDLHRERINVASIHNHVGPDTIGYWGPADGGLIPVRTGVVPEYMITLRHLIAQAIDQAAESARPARLKFSTANIDPQLSLNIHANIRRQKDDVARIMTAVGVDGKPIALLANYGNHVEAMWNDEYISADWAGVFYDRVRKELGAVPLLVEGALGGLVTINPGDDKMAMEKEIMAVFLKHMTRDERIELTNRIGNSFADQVIAAANTSSRIAGPTGLSLRYASTEFYIKVSNFVFEYFYNRGFFDRPMKYRKGVPFMSSDVSIMRIMEGDAALADFTTWPGEPAPTVVAELDAGSPAEFRFTVSLGNDEMGYMVLEKDWNNVEYGYERSMSLGKHATTEVMQHINALRDLLK